jgi:fucose permease
MMFVEKLRESRLFALGFLFSALVFLAHSKAANFVQIVPVQALLAVACSCLYVGALLLLLKHNEEKATLAGILFSTTSIAGAVRPFLDGLVTEFWGGYPLLMYLASSLCRARLIIATIPIRWKA